MLDHGEFARWLEASDDEAGLASQLVDLEAFNAVVLHSEQAAQLVLKGMLRGVGAGSQACGHALSELAERAGAAAGLGLSDVARVLARAIFRQDQKRRKRSDLLVSGGRRRTRTADPLLVRQVLFR